MGLWRLGFWGWSAADGICLSGNSVPDVVQRPRVKTAGGMLGGGACPSGSAGRSKLRRGCGGVACRTVTSRADCFGAVAAVRLLRWVAA